MNVIVFTYKADISGGSNRSLLSILEILVKEGHQVTLILPKKVGQMYDAANKIGVKCIYQPYGRICAKKYKGIKIINQYIKLYSKLIWDYFQTLIRASKYRQLSPDIIYSNGTIIHAGRMLAKRLNLPHVWHIREFIGKDQLMPLNIYHMMNNGTTKFILISNDLYKVYNQHITQDKLIMVSNGIKYIEQPPKIKHEGLNLLLTARICQDKRQIDAIEAMNLICNEKGINDIHLYFAGSCVTNADQSYKESALDLIHKYKLEKKITFLGEVKNMSSLRQNMDIELLCSSREAFGRVTVEAMRSSLVVIGSNAGGTPDIVTDGYNGFMYEPGNIKELSNKIIMLYNDRKLLDKISFTSHEYSKTHFTENQLYKTVNILKDIVSKI